VLKEEMESSVWPDLNDEFEREPFIAKFKSVAGNFDFVMIDIHTKPDDARKEIALLPSVMKYGTLQYGEYDVLCLGDFNADGTYFNERMYEEIFPSTEYNWVIDNSADTSVAKDSNTYDRIVTSKSMDEDFSGRWGVFNFIDEGLLQQFNLAANEMSDHFPIWASYYINNDTD
jgi:endonuclease/exonuclease/phosphatase family metal-dependent hydrolase